ncbi:MAG: hypothetical protein ACOX4V_02225 [Anaerovoracaceae bacterium]|jgi:hydrogenase-4 component B
MKRLLAYHSVENIGIILIGLGISFVAFSKSNEIFGGLALGASLLQLLTIPYLRGGSFSALAQYNMQHIQRILNSLAV